jgi:hypothetical protein
MLWGAGWKETDCAGEYFWGTAITTSKGYAALLAFPPDDTLRALEGEIEECLLE